MTIIIFALKKLETNIFVISVLLSTKIISFFMLFTSFVLSAYWRSYLHIELKHGFDWGRVTGVMSNEIDGFCEVLLELKMLFDVFIEK